MKRINCPNCGMEFHICSTPAEERRRKTCSRKCYGEWRTKQSLARFFERVNKQGPVWHDSHCWEWLGALGADGYGRVEVRHVNRYAHVIAWELTKGAIPAGLTLDHLCRNRKCVNPAHLEVVTLRTNILRGTAPPSVNAAKTHCKRGHELTENNTYWAQGKRSCRTCKLGKEGAPRRKFKKMKSMQ